MTRKPTRQQIERFASHMECSLHHATVLFPRYQHLSRKISRLEMNLKLLTTYNPNLNEARRLKSQ